MQVTPIEDAGTYAALVDMIADCRGRAEHQDSAAIALPDQGNALYA